MRKRKEKECRDEKDDDRRAARGGSAARLVEFFHGASSSSGCPPAARRTIRRARSSMGTRRVPWRDWDEWEETRAGLCGSDPAARDAALARVETWRFRGRVPHAVESTAALMEARLHDRRVPGAVGPFLSEHMLRMVYAMCIVRMVNGAVDPSQKGKFAAPVMTLARKIGIPTALVDIRMEASHQELPSLSLLRHGTERALQWLFERYWAAQRWQLDELRRGARASVAALVDAESKRRRKARRAVERAAANRGRDDAKKRKKKAAAAAGKAKAKRRRVGDDSDDDSDDARVDDASSSDDESLDLDLDLDLAPLDGDGDGPGPSALRKAALNQLFAAVSRDDVATCVEALLHVAVAIATRTAREKETIAESANRDHREPDEPDKPDEPSAETEIAPGASMRDWETVAIRLKKRWTHVHEELMLRAVDGALASPAPAANAPAAVRAAHEGACEAAAAATRVFAAGAAETAAAAREDPMFAGVVARRKALTWHLLRRALAVATPTAPQTKLRDALLAAAPGAGRKFQAKMGRLLRGGGGDSRGSTPGASGEGEGEEGEDEDDDDAFLRAARRATKNAAAAEDKAEDKAEEKAEDKASGPLRAGAFALVQDWTPCAVGDLPAHLRGDPDPARLDPGAALRLAIGKAAEASEGRVGAGGEGGVGVGGAGGVSSPGGVGSPGVGFPVSAPSSLVDVKADLLWGDWPASGDPPALVGFGLAVPGVNYAVGAPFVDPTRRVVADGEADAMGADYVPDAGVASAGAMAAGRRRSRDDPPEEENPGSERLRLAVEEGFRGGESFAFVDPDDDRETDELGDPEPAGEEVDMEEEKGEEIEAARNEDVGDDVADDIADDVADEWGYDEAATEDADEEEEGDGMAVRIGGVRVMLTEEDRDAVASGVECLM